MSTATEMLKRFENVELTPLDAGFLIAHDFDVGLPMEPDVSFNMLQGYEVKLLHQPYKHVVGLTPMEVIYERIHRLDLGREIADVLSGQEASERLQPIYEEILAIVGACDLKMVQRGSVIMRNWPYSLKPQDVVSSSKLLPVKAGNNWQIDDVHIVEDNGKTICECRSGMCIHRLAVRRVVGDVDVIEKIERLKAIHKLRWNKIEMYPYVEALELRWLRSLLRFNP